MLPGSLGSLGIRKFRLLCGGLELPEQADVAADLFRSMCRWSSQAAGDAPQWSTDITDDGTPFEYSVAFDGGPPKIRLLAEARDKTGSSWAAGLRLTASLARRSRADLGRFNLVKDLFAPAPGEEPRFSLWHAATVNPDRSSSFKVYLNPQVHGPGGARSLVAAALERLGMPEAMAAFESCLEGRGAQNRLLYFSLDLAKSADARVKVYVSHENATVDDIEADLEGIEGYAPGDARAWIKQLLGIEGPFSARPVLSCFALRAGESTPAVTVHVPVRCYSANDAEILERVAPLLSDLDGARLAGALAKIAGRPLEVGRGLVTYVSLRRIPTGLNVTTYLSPEAYAIGAPRPSQIPAALLAEPRPSMIRALRPAKLPSFELTMADIEEEIEAFQGRLAGHPFLRRLDAVGTLEDIRVMAPRFTFFVLCFQDMLRLVREHVTDPSIKSMARVHELEDKGHEKWFLHDLEQFGIPLDLRWVFGSAHRATRDLSYEIVSEVLKADDDRARLAIVLSLEAAGHEFFGRVIGFLERIGADGGLKYFARHHQEVEANHNVFAGENPTRLADLVVSEANVASIRAAVARTFAAMTKLATHLEASIAAAARTS